jgi:hypothetical protein
MYTLCFNADLYILLNGITEAESNKNPITLLILISYKIIKYRILINLALFF